MDDDIRVVIIPMPATIKAYTVCKDGFYTIVLNDNLSYEQRYKSYWHEMEHIMNKDFEKDMRVGMLEFRAHHI